MGWVPRDVWAMLGAARRNATATARAMEAACVTWLLAHGVRSDEATLVATPHVARVGSRPSDAPDFERMVVRNTDTRWCHQ